MNRNHTNANTNASECSFVPVGGGGGKDRPFLHSQGWHPSLENIQTKHGRKKKTARRRQADMNREGDQQTQKGMEAGRDVAAGRER